MKLCALLLLMVAQDDSDKFRKALDKFWHRFEAMGMFSKDGVSEDLPDAITKEEDKKFAEAYPAQIKAVAEALAKSGIEATSYVSAIVEDESASKEVLEKFGKSTGALAGGIALAVLSADREKALELLKSSGDDSIAVAAHFSKCLFGAIFTEMTRQRPVRTRLDEALSDALGRKIEPLDYARATLRIVSDPQFMKTFLEPEKQARRVADASDPVWKVIQKELAPGKEGFKGPALWMTFARYHISQADNNVDTIDQAIKEDPDNAAFDYLRAYFLFFKGEDDKALEALKSGNAKKAVNWYTLEIMDGIAHVHEAPLKYYMAVYGTKNPHELWLTDLTRHYVTQRVKGWVDSGKAEAAMNLLDAAQQAYERLLGSFTMADEYYAYVVALRSVLEMKGQLLKGKKGYWDVARKIAQVEWRMLAGPFALSSTEELRVFAATTMLDGAGADAYWAGRRKAGFDRALVERAERLLKDEVIDKVLAKTPSVGGSLDDEEYKTAKAAFDAGKHQECYQACAALLEKDPMHLNAYLLKQKALEQIKE